MEILSTNKPPKLGIILVGIFLVLFGLAAIYIFFLAPKSAELAGVWLVIFGIPWFFFLSSRFADNGLEAISVGHWQAYNKAI